MTPRTDAFDAEHRFVDPDTACYAYSEFARTLERENNELREAMLDLAQYAADEIGVPLNECISGPIGKARAALQKTGGTNV